MNRQTLLNQTPLTLKKMSTAALTNLFVQIYGAFPNTFDRDEIRSDIYLYIFRENGGKSEANIQRDAEQAARNLQHVVKTMAGLVQAPQMTDGDVQAIRALHEDGMGYGSIAKMYGKQPNYIRNIVIRKLYKNVK